MSIRDNSGHADLAVLVCAYLAEKDTRTAAVSDVYRIAATPGESFALPGVVKEVDRLGLITAHKKSGKQVLTLERTLDECRAVIAEVGPIEPEMNLINQAKEIRKLYLSLTEVGFTDEQATRLLVALISTHQFSHIGDVHT